MIDSGSIDAFGWCMMAIVVAVLMVVCDFPVRWVRR